MKKLYLHFLLLVAFLFLFPFATFSQLTPACSPSYPSGGSSWRISSFTLGSFSHNPTSTVHDYTSQSFDMTAGISTTATIISTGWCGVGIAVDFNNDGDFNDPDEILALPPYSANDPATYTLTITIPATVPSGSYRFRVYNRTGNSGNGTPTDSPCGTYAYGNWVDYTVNVTNTSGCQPPTNLNTSNILPASVDLSWAASATSPNSYFWKIVNDGDNPDVATGITGTSTGLSATANGLNNATSYQFYVKSICGSDSSIWSAPKAFTTPCDGLPTVGTASTLTSSICAGVNFTVTLTGQSSGPGISYQWQSSPTGANTWTSITGATNSSSSVSQSVPSDYRVIITCSGSNLSDTSNVISVGINDPVTCYCIPTGTNSNYYINNFSTSGAIQNISNLGSGFSTGGYGDFTFTDTVAQIPSGSVQFSGNYTGSTFGTKIWVDWNQNGNFDDPGEVVYQSSSYTSNASGSFIVPATATTGYTRMRVGISYTPATGPASPCGSGSFEFEDYTFYVQAPTGCLLPTNIAVSGITNDAAVLSWSPLNLGDPYTSFDYELRTSGAAGSGNTGLVTSATNLTDTFKSFTGLTSGIQYSFYVKTNCSPSGQSAWSSAFTFTLPTYVPVAVTGFNADVIANGIGPAMNSITQDVDNAGYALVAKDYQLTATSNAPTYYLPNDRKISNGLKLFYLSDYSASNSLRLPNGSQQGTLQFIAPKRADTLYILGISGSGTSSLTAQVWFNDGTSQSFTNLSYPDWYSSSGNIVKSGVGRININNNNLEGGTNGPNLYENVLAIDAANQNKQIDSIGFSTSSSSAGIMNILGVSMRPNYNQTCTMPSSLSISNVSSNGASVQWSGAGTSNNFQVNYGIQGTPINNGTIITVNGNTNTNLTNLLSSTNYQVFVRSVCSNNSYSDWVGPIYIQTLQVSCTGAPVAGSLSSPNMMACPNTPTFNITNTGATADLDIVYEWYSSPAGLNTWTSLNNNTTAYAVTNQTQATDYRFIVTCTISGLSDTAEITIGQNSANECYCIPTSSNANYFINDFTTTLGVLNINNSNSGYSPNGYGDFTDSIVSQIIGDSITFTANFQNSTFGAKIWIDWNQNGNFDDPGEMVFQSNSYSSTHSGTIVVPSTAVAGNTRMRIGISYTPSTGPSSPCATGNSGEFEDYTFTVLTPCVDPIVDLGNDTLICEGTSLILDAGNPGLSYEWSDGSTNQTLDVQSAGLYYVTVIDGTCSGSDSILIETIPAPSADGIELFDLGNATFDYSVINGENIESYFWNFGDGNTSTDPNPTHTYLQTGLYNVTVAIANICDVTDTLTREIDVFVNSIQNVNQSKKIQMYPNPTSNRLNLTCEETMMMKIIKVYNSLGQLVKMINPINSKQYSLSTEDLATGFYTIQIFTQEGVITQKFEVLK